MHRAIVYNECAEELEGEARVAIEGEPLRDDRLNVSEFEKWWLGYSTDISREEIDLFDIPQMAAAIGIAKAAFAAGRTERVLEAPPREPLTPAVFEEAVYQAQDTGSVHGTETYARRGAEYINSALGLTARAAAPLPTAQPVSEGRLREARERLKWINEKCEQYWNEPNLGDAEVHAALECIHRHAREANAALESA